MNRFTEQNKALAKLSDNALPGAKTRARDETKAPAADSGRPGRSAQKERTPANASPSGVADSCVVDSHADAFRGRWPHHIAAAKTKWGKLSDSDLQAVGGSESKLAELVRQRYALDEEVACKQVRHFIERCNG
jgi:uncharacterized protein YjbJ (UPF0337 family)